MSRYQYWKCCCDFPTSGPKHRGLMDMIDDKIEITRRTFLRHVDTDSLVAIAENMGYERHPSRGLTMASDWHIGYYRSKYRGKRVYFFVHSHIEYIFVPERGFNENL